MLSLQSCRRRCYCYYYDDEGGALFCRIQIGVTYDFCNIFSRVIFEFFPKTTAIYV